MRGRICSARKTRPPAASRDGGLRAPKRLEDRIVRFMRRIGLAVVIGTLLALSGVTAASAASAASAATVRHPYRCGSHDTVRLDDNANGHHVRVCRGATITIALHAPMADSP